MNLYTKQGYPDIASWISTEIPFILCCGGRGTGKTYSALLYAYETGKTFMFIRNSQTQVDRLMKPQYNVFKRMNADKGINITIGKDGKTGIYYDETDPENIKPVGYLAALSTFSNFRGPDLSDVDLIIWDEFIPEAQERMVKDSAVVFFNAYETMNRNRELEGRKPIPVLFLANSNKLDNPMFIELGLVRQAEKMLKNDQQYSINRERGYMIIFLNRSPISEAKQNTVLYKLVGEQSAFFHMSISNSFNLSDTHLIQSCKLTEYKPVVNVGEITVYQHKSNGTYYVSGHMMKTKISFTSSAPDLERFRVKYSWLLARYLQELVYFEDYMSLALFDIYLRNKR